MLSCRKWEAWKYNQLHMTRGMEDGRGNADIRGGLVNAQLYSLQLEMGLGFQISDRFDTVSTT